MTIRALLNPRSNRQNSAEPSCTLGRRVIALSLAILLLPCAQLDLFAQQAYPPPQALQPGYPQQQQQDYPPPPPDDQQQQPQQNYPPQQPYPNSAQQYPQQQYPQQPYPDQQQYPEQAYNQAPQPYAAPQQPQQPLAPDQLDQLIAPIALYPDSLIAQILAASTFPEQIASADRWRQSMGYAAPQDIAAGANAQPWDPSVKALTAFPQVLSELDRNLSWTTELGNAYYNQPQDVFDAIQAMRQRAQAAGTLQNSPQETVTNDQGYLDIAPANPQIVYVPTYDPWVVYGAPINPWPGFFLGAADAFFGLRFGPGFVMSAFAGLPWGWAGWGLSWLGHCLFFGHSGYYPHGPALRDWGLRNGGPRFGWNRSFAYARAYDHGYAHGYARGFNGGAYDRAGAYARGGYNNRGGFDGRSGAAYGGFTANRGYSQNRGWDQNRGSLTNRNGFASRPGYSNGYANNGARAPQQAFNRAPAFNSRPAYGGSYGAYGARPAQNFQSYRGSDSYGRPAQSFNRGAENYGRQSAPTYRAYGGSSSFDRGFSSRSGSFSSGGRSSLGGGSSHSFSGGGSSHFSGGGGSHSFGGGGHSSSGGGHSSGGSHGGGGGGHHR